MVSIFTVDAFTDKAFSGNPAGVCIVPRSDDDTRKWSLSDTVLQNIATEMNISETSFVTTYDRVMTNVFELRWMTPTVEVNLCGHGTLSAAAVVFAQFGDKVGNKLLFHTLSGILVAEKNVDTGKIRMTLPINPPAVLTGPNEVHTEIFKCMNFQMEDLAEIAYSQVTKKLLICLKNFDRNKLEALQPSIDSLVKIDQSAEIEKGENVKGVILTFKDDSDSQYNFLSRYFAPWVGIPEDPVTGSAHTVLTPYWSSKMGGQKSFLARQCSKRGGDLSLQISDDANKVFVSGNAKIVLCGQLNID